MNPSSEHTLLPIIVMQTDAGWEYRWVEHGAWIFKSRTYGRKSSAIQSAKAAIAMITKTGYYQSLLVEVDRDMNKGYEQTR